MNLKSIILAGATVLSLAAPAAMAQPYWAPGYHEGWRDDWRDDWRRHEWREHERWEHRRGWGYAPRCFIENRGSYDWYGNYVYRPVRICR